MLIRSQNKKALVNLNHIDTVYVNTTEHFSYINAFNGAERNYTELGCYSTEEKALKVMHMIELEYVEANCSYTTVNAGYGYVKNTVFNMPRDEEVKVWR